MTENVEKWIDYSYYYEEDDVLSSVESKTEQEPVKIVDAIAPITSSPGSHN